VSEKRRIAELTLEAGASVALVARAHGVNANQVFKWRRALKRGELNESAASTSLLPVMLSAASEAVSETGRVGAKEQSTPGGAIHIEFPGRATISVEWAPMRHYCVRSWRVCASDRSPHWNEDMDRRRGDRYAPRCVT
jgi:transposase